MAKRKTMDENYLHEFVINGDKWFVNVNKSAYFKSLSEMVDKKEITMEADRYEILKSYKSYLADEELFYVLHKDDKNEYFTLCKDDCLTDNYDQIYILYYRHFKNTASTKNLKEDLIVLLNMHKNTPRLMDNLKDSSGSTVETKYDELNKQLINAIKKYIDNITVNDFIHELYFDKGIDISFLNSVPDISRLFDLETLFITKYIGRDNIVENTRGITNVNNMYGYPGALLYSKTLKVEYNPKLFEYMKRDGTLKAHIIDTATKLHKLFVDECKN